MVRLVDGLQRPRCEQVVLSRDGLAVEDEEGRDAAALPLGQVRLYVLLDAGQAAEGGEERLVERAALEELL